MMCPLQTADRGVLLDFAAGRVDRNQASAIRDHLAGCPACREFVAAQAGLWQSLDGWKVPEVSPGFDRAIYARLEEPAGWWQRLMSPFRPVPAARGVLVAAAVCAMVVAGLLIQRPGTKPGLPQRPSAHIETLQPEQVEHALDDLDMLGQFNGTARDGAPVM